MRRVLHPRRLLTCGPRLSLISALAMSLVNYGRAHAQRPVTSPLAFRDVTVINVQDGRRLPHQTVLVVGSRIRALGPAARVRVPKGARTVDARGKYLIPGLWDMHFHQLATGRAHAPVDSAISHRLLIANGITGIRDPGSNVPLARLGQWKRAIAAAAQVGPRMVVAGPVVDEGYDGERDGHVGASTPEKMRRVVDSLRAAGADFIKTYFVSPEMYFAVAAEARRIGIPFGGHGPYGQSQGGSGSWSPEDTKVSGLTLSDSGAWILDHEAWLRGDPCGERNPDSLDVAKCAAAGQHLRRNGTWVVATVAMVRSMYAFPARHYELARRYVPPALAEGLEKWSAWRHSTLGWTEQRPTSAADWGRATWDDSQTTRFDSATGTQPRLEALHHLPILAGTDNGLYGTSPLPGFSLHEQLAVYVAKHGLSPLAALQTATLNPALALHATDSLGTVAPGRLADLVLLDADPLEDIWNTTKIRAVVANGRYFDRAALDGLLTEAERAAHR